MQPHLRDIALAMVLCAAAGSVHAQTVITREIMLEPMEPAIVGQPIIVPEPAATVGELLVVTEPLRIVPSVETTGVRSVETVARPARQIAVPTVAPGQQRAASKSAKAKTATAARKVMSVRKGVGAREAAAKPIRAASMGQPAPAPVVVREAVSLTSGERSVLYRTIVREQIVPTPVITERARPFVAEEIVAGPAAVSAPLVTERVLITRPAPSTPDPLVVEQVIDAPIVAGPQSAGPIVAQRVVMASPPVAATYAVGARLPATVPLYAIPESAALQVPVVRRYSYALVDDRVLLVHPLTGIVMAELDR